MTCHLGSLTPVCESTTSATRTAQREIGYLIPVDPPRRVGPQPSELVVRVQDVLVDERRIVYFTERTARCIALAGMV